MTILNPHISVDCAIFGYDMESLNVLLIQRGYNAVSGAPRYALPGDLIRDDEDLPHAATRVLESLTGLRDIYIRQVGAFGDPYRTQNAEDKTWLRSIREEPDARVVTIGYYALVDMRLFRPEASSFADQAFWLPVDEVGDLAFDHNHILDQSLATLRRSVSENPVVSNLLPEKFTLQELQQIYEAILDKEIDKRNFRRKIKKLGVLKKLDEYQSGVAHKPSRYYSFDEQAQTTLTGVDLD